LGSATWVAINDSGSAVSDTALGSTGPWAPAAATTGGRQAAQNMLRSTSGWPSFERVATAVLGDGAGGLTLGPRGGSARYLPSTTWLVVLAAKVAAAMIVTTTTTQK
jgi:hypothetical protein